MSSPIVSAASDLPGWAKDWRDARVLLIGSGPSSGEAYDAGWFNIVPPGVRVVTINESLRLYPDPDMHYACDAAWWSGTALDWRSLDCVKIAGCAGPHEAAGGLAASVSGYEMKFGRFLDLGGGGNSGFQVLNLLAQMGARECAIIGLDMGGGGYTHWHGPGWPFGTGRLQHKTVDKWRLDTDAAADDLETAGLTVVNASPVSALENYSKESLADIFARWES